MGSVPTPEDIISKIREFISRGLPYLDQARGYVQSVLLLPFLPAALKSWLQFLDLVLQAVQHAAAFTPGANSFAPLALNLS